jgi:hypothetical protein
MPGAKTMETSTWSDHFDLLTWRFWSVQIVWGRRRCHALSVVRVQRWLHINIEEWWSAAVVKAVASLLTEMVQTPSKFSSCRIPFILLFWATLKSRPFVTCILHHVFIVFAALEYSANKHNRISPCFSGYLVPIVLSYCSLVAVWGSLRMWRCSVRWNIDEQILRKWSLSLCT